jgi:TP901 family phage tail tape measure protein
MTTAAELVVKVSADTASAEGDLRSFSSRMLSGAGGMGAVFGGTLLTAGVMGVGRAVGGLARGVVGLGADAVSAGASFAYSMDQVSAVLGATDEQAAQLAQTAVSLGMNPNLKVSTEEAATAMYSLATAGLTTEQIVGGAAEATVLLANATGGDMAQAGQVATDAMALWGMSADQLGESINGVVGVSNASKFDLNDYALALAQGGGVAAMAGLSFEDFNATIAASSSYFASGSDAGTSLKTMLAQLTPTTAKAKDAMFDLGLITEDGKNQFYDAEGNLRGMYDIVGLLNGATKDLTEEQRKQYLQTIFGNDAMRSAGALAGMTADEYEAMYMVVNEGTDALGQAKTRTDNLSSSWETFKDTIDAAKTNLGLTMEVPLQMAVKALTPLVDQVSTFIQPYIDEAAAWLTTNIPVIEARIPIAVEAYQNAPGFISGVAAAIGELSGKSGELKPVVEDLSAMDEALKAFNTTGANPFPVLIAGMVSSLGEGTTAFDEATGTFTAKWKAFQVEMSKTGEIEIHPQYKFIDDAMGGVGIVEWVREQGNKVRVALGGQPITVDQEMKINPIWSDKSYEPFDINKWIMDTFFSGPPEPVDYTQPVTVLPDYSASGKGFGLVEWLKTKLFSPDPIEITQPVIIKVAPEDAPEDAAIEIEPLVKVTPMFDGSSPSTVQDLTDLYAGRFTGGAASFPIEVTPTLSPEFSAADIQATMQGVAGTVAIDVTGDVKGVEFNTGAYTNTYDVEAAVATDPVWGSYTYTYGTGAKVDKHPNFGNWTWDYKVTATVTHVNNLPTGGGGGAGGQATGSVSAPAGLTWVGERGPELVALPGASRVWNNRESMAMAGAGGPQVVINASVANAIDLEALARRVGQYLRRG